MQHFVSLVGLSTEDANWYQSALPEPFGPEEAEFLDLNSQSLSTKIIGMLFASPSVRTRFSFESISKRLGANTLACGDLEQTWSGSQGAEPLSETARFMSNYCDLLVVRAPNAETVERLAECSRVPVVSAGHGVEEHPTAALNHLLALKPDSQGLAGRSIALAGHLPKRTLNSIALGALALGVDRIICLHGEDFGQMSDWCRLAEASGTEVCGFTDPDAFLQAITDYRPAKFIIDESQRDYNAGKRLLLSIDAKRFRKLEAVTSVTHAKPVLQAFTPDVLTSLQPALLKQSRRSMLLRGLILLRLIGQSHVH